MIIDVGEKIVFELPLLFPFPDDVTVALKPEAANVV